MTTETLYFWTAAKAARCASDTSAARDAIEDLAGIALHGSPHIARRALDILHSIAAGSASEIASQAGEAVAWCEAQAASA